MTKSTSSWFDPWPAWSSRWFGWVARAVILISAGVVGLALLVLADFAANGLSDANEWDGEASTVLVLGVATLIVGLGASFRPSRATVIALALVVVAIPLSAAIM